MYAVNSEGKVANILSNSSDTTVNLNTSGSGAYKVIVTATSGDYEATSSFYLYVMPVFESLSAHIAVSTS